MSRAKVYFAVLGFCLAAAGIALDSRPLVWAAIVVLTMAMGLRLWLNRNGREARGKETGQGREGREQGGDKDGNGDQGSRG